MNIKKRGAKWSALSPQVTARQLWTDAKAWQTQDINNINDQQKKYCPVRSVKYLTEGLKPFRGANLTLKSA